MIYYCFHKKDNCLGDMVKKNILICDNCLSRNYHINISKRNNRLKLKKYCPQCKNHILHEESR